MSDLIECSRKYICAKKLWDYLNFRIPLVHSDAIVVLCSHDLRIAHYASELYDKGWAPLLVFSGGLSKFTARLYSKSEAETFADIARAKGISDGSIVLETKSTNTQENLEFTMGVLNERGVLPQKLILVQKPNMLRRVFATANKLFPEISVATISHNINFEEAPHEHVSREMFIHEMVGDLHRIKVYAEKGFTIPQEIDPDVLQAFDELRKMGYDRNMIK